MGMIKSLFDEEENDKKAGKTGKAESGPPSILTTGTEPKEPVSETVAKPESTESKADPSSSEPVVPFEIGKPIGLPNTDDDSGAGKSPNQAPAAIESASKTPLELKVFALEDELAKLRAQEGSEKPVQTEPAETGPEATADPEVAKAEPEVPKAEPKAAKEVGELAVFTEKASEADNKNEVHANDFVPVSRTASIRNSGLAYSAAIALFGSVIFMLIMGWFADLLLGIQPWGTVIGIVLGATIGFFQFIRLTSQIINPKPTDFEKVSILNRVGEIEHIETADPLETADSIPENPDALELGTPEAVTDAIDTPDLDLPEVPQPEPAENKEAAPKVTADLGVEKTREAVGTAVRDAEHGSEETSESDPLDIPEFKPISKV